MGTVSGAGSKPQSKAGSTAGSKATGSKAAGSKAAGSKAAGSKARPTAWLRAWPEAWPKAWQRLKDGVWPILQQSLAAVVSWWIAGNVLDQSSPLFAPIAAIVALNTPRGRRGENAIRVMLSVTAGVLIGDLASSLPSPDEGSVSVAVAVFLALGVALLLDGQRVTMGQAGVSAVIAVVAGQEVGGDRVLEVLIGGGVALVFSQLIFPAHPLAMLRRAEGAMLEVLADALALTREALVSSDREHELRLWDRLRPVFDVLTDLQKVRDDAVAATRRVPAWWGQHEPVSREQRIALRLDLLGHSCVTLARAAMSLDEEHRHALAPQVGELANTLRLLSKAPGNGAVRRRGAQRALAVVADVPSFGHAAQIAVWESVQLVARDILAFAGATPEAANRAVHEEAGDIHVSAPPKLQRPPRPPLPGWPTRRRTRRRTPRRS